MTIVETEPFPSVSLQDHMKWIDAVYRQTSAMKVRGIDAYRLDVNWITFAQRKEGSWSEVVQLREYCRSRGLPFGLIYWPPAYPSANRLGTADDSTWYVGIMEEGYEYNVAAARFLAARKLANGLAGLAAQPDQYVIESWVGAPVRMIPETAEFTFTRSVLDFVNKFVNGRANP